MNNKPYHKTTGASHSPCRRPSVSNEGAYFQPHRLSSSLPDTTCMVLKWNGCSGAMRAKRGCAQLHSLLDNHDDDNAERC